MSSAINNTTSQGGVYMNDLAGCNPCAIDTAPGCEFNGTHNVADANVACQPFNVTGAFYLQDYIDDLHGAAIPVKKVFTEKKGILNFLMDLKSSIDVDGRMTETAMFKEMKGLEVRSAVDGTFYQRGEWYNERPKFYVTQDYALVTNTIQIGIKVGPSTYTPSLGAGYDARGTGSIIVGDTVRIFQRDPAEPECCANEIIKTVIAVNTTNFTITLEPTVGGGPSSYVFTEGDEVEFMRHGRNDCEIVEKGFGLTPPMKRVAYIQNVDNLIQFSKIELNTAYQAYSDAQKYVNDKLFHLNKSRVDQMANIAYLGRNRRMTQGQATKGETQGIITGIRDAQIRHPEKNLIIDMSATINDDDRVRIIYNELLKIQDSGRMQGGEPVIFLMNRIATNAVTKMHRAWNNLLGVTVNKTEVSNKMFTYPVIDTPAGISMVNAYCEHLSELYKNEGIIIMFPKNALALYSRENQKVTANGQALNVQKAVLTSKFEDVSPTNATECRDYRIMLEYAQFVMGTDSGAFRMIKGLKDC